MAKYTERKTTGVQLSEIDAVDVAIVLRLLETKKLIWQRVSLGWEPKKAITTPVRRHS